MKNKDFSFMKKNIKKELSNAFLQLKESFNTLFEQVQNHNQRIEIMEKISNKNELFQNDIKKFLDSVETLKSFGMKVLSVACASAIVGVLKLVWDAFKILGIF